MKQVCYKTTQDASNYITVVLLISNARLMEHKRRHQLLNKYPQTVPIHQQVAEVKKKTRDGRSQVTAARMHACSAITISLRARLRRLGEEDARPGSIHARV
jgi:hypothetical protein